MFQVLYFLVHALQPVLVPLCFLFGWMVMILMAWSFCSAIAEGLMNAKRMHSIPCANCRYFTGDYRLKCTVQPHVALSEAAIDCPDYRPMMSYSLTSQERI